MGSFLGPIHYRVYDKIVQAEQLEEDIVLWAKTKEIPADKLFKGATDQYGGPTGGKPLEEVIDTQNIHGWLQSRIERVESRQAYLITKILEINSTLKDEIIQLFEKQGAEAARKYTRALNTPEEAFNALNEFIIEGMPCDRVNEVIRSDEDKFIWKTIQCLHKPYWDRVKGDVHVFYTLRDAWVKSFIQSLGFEYTRSQEAIHEIIKKNQ